MREIKFRVWDIKNKAMIYSDEVEFDWILIDLEGGLHQIDMNELESYNGELMQYTGLKDKNGKEIYEGDIVEYTRETRKTGKVHYDLEGACYMFNDDEIGANINDIVVIGSIYENKDLIVKETL